MAKKSRLTLLLGLLGLLNGAQAQTWSINVVPSTTPITCNSFECAKDSHFPSDIQCSVLKPDKLDEFYVRECSSSQFCPFSISGAAECTYIDNSTPGARLPGEICATNSNCISLSATTTDPGVCTKNVCQGLAISQTCLSSQQCTGNSFCDAATKLCAAPLALGETCILDEQCGVFAICYFENSTASGVCARAFSKPPGTSVYPCLTSNYNSMACDSGICYQASANDSFGICQGKLKVQNDNTCTSNLQCMTDNGTTGAPMYTTCACAQNQDKEAYCSRGPGNNESDDYFKYLADWLAPGSVPVTRCNVTDRFSTYCMQAQLDTELYEQYTYDAFKATHYELYKNTDECLLKAGYPQFYKEIIKDYDDDDDLAAKLVVAVSFMLLLL